jgi:hypothetical protein
LQFLDLRSAAIGMIGLGFMLSACSPHAATTAITPVAAQAAPADGARHTMSEETFSISGTSTHQTERERCSTGNDPPAPQWYISNWVGGSSTQSWQVNTATPATSTSELAITLTTDHPLVVTITSPTTVVASQTIAAGTSTVAYYDPNAASGVYTFSVRATVNDNGGDCGGTGTPTTYTDATYSGYYTWPGAPRYPLGKRASI